MLANRSYEAIAVAALTAGAMLFLAAPAVAQRAATTGRAADENSKRGVAAASGEATAPVNPSGTTKTPTLREPTRDEIEVLLDGMAPQLSTSTEDLVPVYHDDGAVSVDLQGRFQSVAIARVEADGSISQRCVTSKEEARQFLTQSTKQPAPKPPIRGSTTAPKVKPALEEK